VRDTVCVCGMCEGERKATDSQVDRLCHPDIKDKTNHPTHPRLDRAERVDQQSDDALAVAGPLPY
jgi:hypothetical protein